MEENKKPGPLTGAILRDWAKNKSLEDEMSTYIASLGGRLYVAETSLHDTVKILEAGLPLPLQPKDVKPAVESWDSLTRKNDTDLKYCSWYLVTGDRWNIPYEKVTIVGPRGGKYCLGHIGWSFIDNLISSPDSWIIPTDCGSKGKLVLHRCPDESHNLLVGKANFAILQSEFICISAAIRTTHGAALAEIIATMLNAAIEKIVPNQSPKVESKPMPIVEPTFEKELKLAQDRIAKKLSDLKNNTLRELKSYEAEVTKKTDLVRSLLKTCR